MHVGEQQGLRVDSGCGAWDYQISADTELAVYQINPSGQS